MKTMMDIKLIASDIDGTILPHGGRISDETRRAVRMCGESGVKFVIASGRWYVPAKVIANELELQDWMIIVNGGAIVQPDGTPIKEWFMDPEDVDKAYGIAKKYDVMINAFVRNALYRVNTQALKSRIPGANAYLGSDLYKEVKDDWEAFETKGLKNTYKMEVYSDDHGLLAEIRKELEAAGLAVTSSYPNNLEIMSQGMGKGAALYWLAEHIGATMDQVMACGDNLNDIAMLDVAGWPLAVENAVDEVKAIARIIAPACEDDGVAKVIVRDILGKE